MMYGDAVRQRFWSKVDQSAGPDACWPWTAGTNGKGYGRFYDGQRIYAHRLAYELATGARLGKLQIDHICHNPPCCNPGHLRPATNKQNNENRQGAQRNSQTGVQGVSPSSAKELKAGHKRYTAKVWHHGKTIRVGFFDTVEEAAEAVKAKRLELFTHNDADRKESLV